jgi:hypothetical protein
MAFTSTQLEELVKWCAASEELRVARDEARQTFFGDDESSPAQYWPGTGDAASRSRRFLGWFMLDVRLPDGLQPAEVAARHIWESEALAQARTAIRGTRFVTAVIAAILLGRGALLEVEAEHFEVRSRAWAQMMRRDRTVMAHLLPIREDVWLPGPGWLELPIALGPGMKRELKTLLRPTPVEVERLLQGRTTHPERRTRAAQPEDATLAEAVARMTNAAEAQGRGGLVLSAQGWERLVLRYLYDADTAAFFQDVIERVGPVEQVEELNGWLALALNIWNTTPQPDRDGQTAYQLSGKGLHGQIDEETIELDGWRGTAEQVDTRDTS